MKVARSTVGMSATESTKLDDVQCFKTRSSQNFAGNALTGLPRIGRTRFENLTLESTGPPLKVQIATKLPSTVFGVLLSLEVLCCNSTSTIVLSPFQIDMHCAQYIDRKKWLEYSRGTPIETWDHVVVK